MTINRTYYCDLCNSSKKLIGVYWGLHNKIELKPYRTVEHHICIDCLKQLRELTVKEITEMIPNE